MDNREFYNSIADKYNFRNSNPTTLFLRRKERGLIRKFSSGRILDIGCGTGYHIRYLDNIIGADISEDMLKLVKPIWKPLILADILNIPFQDRVFDTVICMYSVLNIVDPGGSAREISRVLRPGGLVIISAASVYDNNYSMDEKKKLSPGSHTRKKSFAISKKTLSMRLFTKEDLTRLFSKFGLEMIHFSSIFINVKPRWNNFRDFSKRERLTLKTEQKFLDSKYGCVYLMVFRKGV